jgi:hypothetical protein
VAERPGESAPEQKAPELPDVRGPRVPVGYRPGFQLEERLQGLLLVLLGLAGLALLQAVPLLTGGPGGPGGAPGPRGLPAPPLLAPATCLTPAIAVGSVGLILIGLRQMIRP